MLLNAENTTGGITGSTGVIGFGGTQLWVDIPSAALFNFRDVELE
jgi:hypothetical protein